MTEAGQEDEEAAANEHIEQDDGQDIPGVLGDEVAQLDGVRQGRHRTAQKVGRELDQGQDYDGQSTATRQAVDFLRLEGHATTEYAFHAQVRMMKSKHPFSPTSMFAAVPACNLYSVANC